MTDRKLLEFAAKAAGIDVFWWPADNPVAFRLKRNNDLWNPLTDDGDALRLMVRLRMCVEPWGAGASAVVSIDNRSLVAEPHYGDDPERATRRAIVRAAAEIGRRIP